MRAWDKENNGEIPKASFIENIKDLLPGHPEPEISALFDGIDDDHSGTMSLRELKPFITKMSETATQAAASPPPPTPTPFPPPQTLRRTPVPRARNPLPRPALVRLLTHRLTLAAAG